MLYFTVIRTTPGEDACDHAADVCPGLQGGAAGCRETLDDIEQQIGRERSRAATECLQSAGSCDETIACIGDAIGF